MEFRDALKLFRNELGLAQADIAIALHINIATVGRWEQGKTVPSRSFAMALLDYAKSRSASKACIESLEKTLSQAAKKKLFNGKNSLFSVEHATISQLIEDAAFPIYVCDLNTDEILYANRSTEQQLGKSLDELVGRRCYESIMCGETPCEFCHKHQLTENSFSAHEAFRRFDGKKYRVFGKLAKWNGRPAQVRYVFEVGGSVQIASTNELRLKYEEQLSMHREFAGDALAIAHYNLTEKTISQLEYRSEAIARHNAAGSYEGFIRALQENIFAPDEKKKLDSIRSSDLLIKQYFMGKTHISIKHRIKGLSGYFEAAFDLFQNPTTYDIEAFTALRDITNEAVSDAVVGMIIRGGFEIIMTIDAVTGEARFLRGRLMGRIISERRKQEGGIADMEEYLRRYCPDADAERVMLETSLPFVKEQLKTKLVLTVACSLCEDGRLKHKQIQYSYLDKEQSLILCVMQDISEAYKQLAAKESAAGLTKQKTADTASESDMGEQ